MTMIVGNADGFPATLAVSIANLFSRMRNDGSIRRFVLHGEFPSGHVNDAVVNYFGYNAANFKHDPRLYAEFLMHQAAFKALICLIRMQTISLIPNERLHDLEKFFARGVDACHNHLRQVALQYPLSIEDKAARMRQEQRKTQGE